jgi:plastocyanin
MNQYYQIKAWIVILFCMIGFGVQSQVIINEISYNPPESGTDSLEYIELFNAGAAPVNIDGWYFQTGIEDTLPNVEIQPGSYFVTAVNAQAMMNVFEVVAHQWSAGGLNNNGEVLKLVDGGGNLVDSVLYDDVNPWPTEPDGNGPSVELTDSGLDNNDGANWQFSGGSTGVIIEGNEVMGTPGAENSGGGTPGPDLTIDMANFAFIPNIAVVEVGAVVRWVNNEGDAHNVNGQQSDFPANPASFFSGFAAPGPWQYEFEFTIPGTYHYQCDPHVGLGMTGIIYVYDPLNYNDFSLAELRQVNANGSALFDGVPTTVTGVVHGVNYQPTGYSFFVIDADNAGINVFSFDPGNYVVTAGDELSVSGVIDQFNGLLEIIPDTIVVISTGNGLNNPRTIDEVTESDESSYLFSETLGLDSISNISASGFTMYTEHSVSGAKVLIRIDADANLGITPGDFNIGAWILVWGIGTQFDNQFPFTSGYQILAVAVYEFIDGLLLLDKDQIQMMPNPASNAILFNSDIILTSIEVFSMDGKSLLLKQVNSSAAEIDISALPVGLHFVKVITDQGIWTSLLSVMRN